MNVREKRVLQRLHKKVVEGQEAARERDAWLLHYNDDGHTQTELAGVLEEAFPGTMSRNACQKIISRERARSNGHGR